MLKVAARHRLGAFTLDVAFAAPGAGVVALFGPSGSGKSSTLAVVAGLLRPDAGRVTVDGRVLLDTAAGVAVPAERRRCGMVFQDARLFPHMSVEGNLRYGLRRAPPGIGPGFDEVVALLGIADLLRRRPARLSGGERQRVALGRALLSRPALLLMDEPLAALDGARKAEILPFLERVRDAGRVPVLYVTHALDEVDRLADTLVLLDAGRVQAAGPLEALTARTDLPGLSGRRDAGAVLRCVVAAHDEARGLTRLTFAGGTLVVPLRGEAVGAGLRLRLRARDVSIAIAAPMGLSSHNALHGTVTAVAAAGPHEAFVTVTVGPTALLARVTRDSVSGLGLVPGRAVVGLVKSTAFDHG